MKKSNLLNAVCAVLFSLITMSANAALHGGLPLIPGGTDYQAAYDDVLDISWVTYEIANALIIMDFESVTTANSNQIVQGDFEINMGGPYGFMSIFLPSASSSHPHPQNGTKYVQMSTQRMHPAILTAKNGSTFDIVSIDLGEYSSVHRLPRSSTFKGYTVSGETLTQIFTVDGFFDGIGGENDFETFNFGSEWRDLTRVEFGYVHTFDNIAISTVPVPTAVWLFGSGLIGLIGIARRKKAVSPS